AGGEHGEHVRALKPRRDLHFLLEAGGADLAGHLRREDLDDDLAIERALGAEEEAAHAAAGELAVDAVCIAERGLEAGKQVGLRHGGKVTREAAWCARGAPRLREAPREARLREAGDSLRERPAGSAAQRAAAARATHYARRADSPFPVADSPGEGGGGEAIADSHGEGGEVGLAYRQRPSTQY